MPWCFLVPVIKRKHREREYRGKKGAGGGESEAKRGQRKEWSYITVLEEQWLGWGQ